MGIALRNESERQMLHGYRESHSVDILIVNLNLSDSDFSFFSIKFQPFTFYTYDRSRYLTIDEFGRMLFKLDGDAHGNFDMEILG